ncbi:MAG: large subunit ribosomal protein L14 [Parcubacteria group bacterium Gr01-1014_107]|nr:MAG: large subunit ribosomal protein L14 [Parcubacteria group bacterium Gr01-1014_107]
MIQPRSIVNIADNSGAKIGRIFRVLGGTKRKYARIGDLVILSVQKAEPRKLVKKKDVLRAVVVRQKTPFRRQDSSYIRFDDNAVIILNKENNEPIATRIFGPVPKELGGRGFQKIISLAPEVI